MISEMRRVEEIQRRWAEGIEPMNSIAEQIRKLTETGSATLQLAKQLQGMEIQRLSNIKKMLDPLDDIRKSIVLDSGVNKMLEYFTKSNLVRDEFDGLVNNRSYLGVFSDAFQNSTRGAFAHAQEVFAATSVTNAFSDAMKTYELAQKRWIVPPELVGSIGALKAMQEQIGKLTLPVIDWASAATLAKLLGPEGIEAQLAALGIQSDGTPSEHEPRNDDQGLGISRKAMELMTLLSLILAILVPIYQEISSSEWQQQTDKTLAAHGLMMEAQAKRMERLSSLVERALVAEAKRVDERFVVSERVVTVRLEPRSGSATVAKLLPREVVVPVSEQGKWIQFEYYHWLLQEHRTGWAPKKYFKRVPSTYKQDS